MVCLFGVFHPSQEILTYHILSGRDSDISKIVINVKLKNIIVHVILCLIT